MLRAVRGRLVCGRGCFVVSVGRKNHCRGRSTTSRWLAAAASQGSSPPSHPNTHTNPPAGQEVVLQPVHQVALAGSRRLQLLNAPRRCRRRRVRLVRTHARHGQLVLQLSAPRLQSTFHRRPHAARRGAGARRPARRWAAAVGATGVVAIGGARPPALLIGRAVVECSQHAQLLTQSVELQSGGVGGEGQVWRKKGAVGKELLLLTRAHSNRPAACTTSGQ
eukprot:362393-Chlamydomonas_euryale.AAC.1